LSTAGLRAQFLDAPAGRIFAVLRPPRQPGGPAVLVVPPFAEEMNKSRRMIAEVGRRLEGSGVGMLLVDLFGTGDSEGEFAQADWQRWKSDIAMAVHWAAAEGAPIRGMLGIRLGCILGSEALAGTAHTLQRTVMWQPVPSGRRFLEQFLRLRVAASMMGGGDSKETVAALRTRLKSGELLEVAGYEISGTLADQLDAAELQPFLKSHLGEVHWMEAVRSADTALSGPSTTAIDAARASGLAVTAHSVMGEPFWSATEIVCLDEMVARTADVLGSLDA
jgi:exosortase A-associated hydrolase 2